MLHLVLYPLLTFIWNCIGNYLYTNIDNLSFKLSRTHVSAIHASSVILSYLIGVPLSISYYLSITYYIMDTLYEIVDLIKIKKSVRVFDFGVILHHFICISMIGYLYYPHISKYMFKAFYFAELSNMPMYLVYHLKVHGYDNKYLMKGLILVEAMGFIILRILMGGAVTYEMIQIDDVPVTLKASAIIILIISAIWSNKLVRQFLG